MADILIVDDELSMRQFLTHLFQRDGHVIRVAENGRKAMAMLREQPADVLISDVKMPDMGGIELLRAARELHPDIEVIMMTAFANEQTAHEAFLLGSFDFVHKPFDNNLLKEKVVRALQKISIIKEKQALQVENEALIKGQRARGQLGNIIGRSERMQSLELFDEGRNGGPFHRHALAYADAASCRLIRVRPLPLGPSVTHTLQIAPSQKEPLSASCSISPNDSISDASGFSAYAPGVKM